MNSNLATVSPTVTWVNQPPVLTVVPQNPMQGTYLNGVAVATFTDVDADQIPGTHTAVIDWGDGTPATAGVLTRSGSSFLVTGSHVYDNPGSFVLRVSVTDPSGGTDSKTAAATVNAIPPQFVLNGTLNTGGAGVTKDQSPVVNGTAPPGDVVTLYGNADQWLGAAVANPDGTFQITTQTLPEGTYAMTLSAVNPNAPGTTLRLTDSLGSLTVRSHLDPTRWPRHPSPPRVPSWERLFRPWVESSRPPLPRAARCVRPVARRLR